MAAQHAQEEAAQAEEASQAAAEAAASKKSEMELKEAAILATKEKIAKNKISHKKSKKADDVFEDPEEKMMDNDEQEFQSFAAKAKKSGGKISANSFAQQTAKVTTSAGAKNKNKKVDLYKEAARIAIGYVEGDEIAGLDKLQSDVMEDQMQKKIDEQEIAQGRNE